MVSSYRDRIRRGPGAFHRRRHGQCSVKGVSSPRYGLMGDLEFVKAWTSPKALDTSAFIAMSRVPVILTFRRNAS
jgi:hypothetical protein